MSYRFGPADESKPLLPLDDLPLDLAQHALAEPYELVLVLLLAVTERRLLVQVPGFVVVHLGARSQVCSCINEQVVRAELDQVQLAKLKAEQEKQLNKRHVVHG